MKYYEGCEEITREKTRDFQAKMKLGYDFKKAYAARRAWEFYNHPEVAGRCYVAVGGLDSITLFLFLRSIGIDVPATSVSMLEDRSIQRVHKALGVKGLLPVVNQKTKRPYNKVEVIREYGFPVLSKEIAGKIYTLQHPTEKNATVRHAIMTGETGAYGGYRKGTRMKMAQKWLEIFGGPENEREGTEYKTAPFQVSELCCYYLKEKPCDDYAKESGRFPYMGLMASEGGRRQKALMLNGCNYISKTTKRSAPFAIFTRQDLLTMTLEMEAWYQEHWEEFDGNGEHLETIVPEIYGKIVRDPLNMTQEEIEEYKAEHGGTEADNWAIRAARYGDGHVVASAFEHHAIIHALEAMAREKERNVELVKPERDGIVDPERVRRNVSQYTNLVTVMAANNEVGTIQPVEEIGREIRKGGNKRTIFHTDAVQAVGHIPVDVQKMGVDMLSLSAHKFGGPKGVGVLYCRNGIILDPLLFGGGQERGNRPGTENTPGIVAMAVAMREACKNMESAAAKTRELRDRLIRRIKEIPDSYIHGSLEKRLPGNINCSFAGVEGEAVVIMLDLAGVCASSGSACTSGTGEPSHVLTAMGLSRKDAYGAIRITLAETNTEAEVDYIGDQLAEIVRKLRG